MPKPDYELAMPNQTTPERRAATVRRYNTSSKGLVSRAKYNRSPLGKAARTRLIRSSVGKEGQRRRNATPNGQARLARARLRRNSRSTNPEAYAIRVLQMLCGNEPCIRCGVTAEQLDHKIPLALGGTDDWNNLQPLCKACHRAKTSEDLREIYKVTHA